ncbi:putative Fe-containing alcohol dehydrogenase [Xylariaceae sp. AK1471]|nr:putative Fe-containing alcohol dehydrogenase [Xylariaceae sp. AK1471]
MSEIFGRAFPNSPTPLLSYGLPFISSLLKHVDDTFHASKLYVVCSKSLAKNTSYLDDLKQQLGDKLVGTRVGMRSHSLWSEILEIVADVKRCEADCIVTLGAGSLIDAAKVVSYAIANSVSTPDELKSLSVGSASKRPNVRLSEIPIISIPTSLSGGEYSSFAGATNDADGRKHSFSGPEIKGPSLVILDPELATTTPPSVWLSTGVRAIDHCVETLCSLQSNEGADEAARLGLKRLVPGLLRCKENPEDIEGRLECFLGSRDAMAAATSGVPMGASHGIGHQLGPAGVGHGETSCILNPAVCKYNYVKKANVTRQDAITEILWHDTEASAIFEKKGLKKESAILGDLMDAIIRALGLPRTLKEFGIDEDKLDGIAEHSLQDRAVKTNPAHLDKEGVLEILRMVLQ